MTQNQQAIYDARTLGTGKMLTLGLQHMFAMAPEISFYNYYYTTAAYNKLNSFVAFTAAWALNYNLLLQLSGTWNTLYDQKNTIQYRNLLIFHVSAAFSF